MDELLAALANDPAQRRRRWLAATAGLVALATALLAVRHFGGERVRLCEGGTPLAGVWDAARRDAVQRAFARSGKPWAAQAAAETTRALDGYATAWAAAHVDACAATRLRGEETEAIMELRMSCLDDRKKELAALTELFVVADDETVERSVQAVDALPPVSVCADVKTLSSVAPPPADPKLRALIAEERTALATARARLGAGKYKDGLAQAELIAPVAQQLGYRPLIAETQALIGKLRFKSGDYQGADRAWRDALYAAEEARLDESEEPRRRRAGQRHRRSARLRRGPRVAALRRGDGAAHRRRRRRRAAGRSVGPDRARLLSREPLSRGRGSGAQGGGAGRAVREPQPAAARCGLSHARRRAQVRGALRRRAAAAREGAHARRVGARARASRRHGDPAQGDRRLRDEARRRGGAGARTARAGALSEEPAAGPPA